jgi:hypothetical protein
MYTLLHITEILSVYCQYYLIDIIATIHLMLLQIVDIRQIAKVSYISSHMDVKTFSDRPTRHLKGITHMILKAILRLPILLARMRRKYQ